MTAPRLRLVSETREQRIERWLKSMGEAVTDLSLPLPVRRKVCEGYAALHSCRDAETVRKMERNKGLR